MYKFKKSVSLLLLCCILISCLPITALAGRPEQFAPDASVNVDSSVEQFAETAECATISETERVIETLRNVDAEISFKNTLANAVQADNGSDELEVIENLFDCTLNVEAAHQILDTATDSEYTRFVCEDRTELSFSEDGGLVKISTIYNEPITDQTSELSVKEMQNVCLDMMPDLYQLFEIEKEYILTDTYDFDEDYLFFTFEKQLENGVVNPLQSINVVFNKDTLKFSIAVKFDSAPNAIKPQISESEAIAAANEKVIDGNMLNSAELTYISDRAYSLALDHYNGNICYLVYEVSSLDSDCIIYIDALSGEYVCRDIKMGEAGLSAVIQESANPSAYNYNSDLVNYTSAEIARLNTMYRDKMNWAASAMGRLGYTATAKSYTTSQMITDIKNYLKALTNEYAFYFSGHGSTTVLGFKQNGWIRPSDVTGNWHFVFLDGCSTAADSGWADAFKINGYSNRAFLGWNTTVYSNNIYKFAEKFWPLINGTNTVRQAAVDAAALVPGSGTTPIKFYGDVSYTGRAWS